MSDHLPVCQRLPGNGLLRRVGARILRRCLFFLRDGVGLTNPIIAVDCDGNGGAQSVFDVVPGGRSDVDGMYTVHVPAHPTAIFRD